MSILSAPLGVVTEKHEPSLDSWQAQADPWRP